MMLQEQVVEQLPTAQETGLVMQSTRESTSTWPPSQPKLLEINALMELPTQMEGLPELLEQMEHLLTPLPDQAIQIGALNFPSLFTILIRKERMKPLDAWTIQQKTELVLHHQEQVEKHVE
jgi:hypothetical protein